MPENVHDILNILECSPFIDIIPKTWENVYANKVHKEIQKRFWLQSADAPFARGWSVSRGFIPIICRFLKFTREMLAPIIFCDRNNIGHIPWMFYFRWTCLPLIMIKRSASLAERFNIQGSDHPVKTNLDLFFKSSLPVGKRFSVSWFRCGHVRGCRLRQVKIPPIWDHRGRT